MRQDALCISMNALLDCKCIFSVIDFFTWQFHPVVDVDVDAIADAMVDDVVGIVILILVRVGGWWIHHKSAQELTSLLLSPLGNEKQHRRLCHYRERCTIVAH